MEKISAIQIRLITALIGLSFFACNSEFAKKFPNHSLVTSADGSSKRGGVYRLFKSFVGDNGRVYGCSGKDFFAVESNGTIAWSVHLYYTCDPIIAPVHGGSSMIYLVAENRVLKIHPLRIKTPEPAVEVFFGSRGVGEIVGISASVLSSCVLINVRNRALFAFRLSGQLIWSAGPVLYQNGFRQGCRKNIAECYFTSPPVIDHCEASIFISNTVGELYCLSVRGPYFKWIQDISSYGNTFKITPGNNGCVYVTIPDAAVVLALDVSTGSILWQGKFGPLSSADYEPVVDANGWISYGSLDGFLYSFSPMGELRKFPTLESLHSVIQLDPVLDCSGYAVYISQTEMEGNFSRDTANYTYVSALKPEKVVFTLLVPSSGSILWSKSDPGKFLFNLSKSDLQRFIVDEKILLTFFVASRNGNPLPCRSTSQKLLSVCSKVKPDNTNIYTGNKRTIVLFLIIESLVLVILATVVWYCCIFWKKRKLQGLDLGSFLEKRHSLWSKMRAFDQMIADMEHKTSEEVAANEVLEKLSDLVKEREGIKRKLSTTYSLGRDGENSRAKSLLPLYGGKTRSFSFKGSKKENVTVSDSSNISSCSSGEYSGHGEVESSGEEFGSPRKSFERSVSEIEEARKCEDDERGVVGSSKSGGRSLRRRTVSFN